MVIALFLGFLSLPLVFGFSFNALKKDGVKDEIEGSSVRGSPRFEEAFLILEQSSAGNRLLRHARRKWNLESIEELISMLRWGAVSKTDAVLTRQLDLETGKEIHSRKITIFIKHNQNLQDLVLDLAHELTHAIQGPAWNPYDPSLTARSYIKLAIEGKGGEVDALLTECQVARELAVRYALPTKRCDAFVLKSNGNLSKRRIRKEFYKVGKYKKMLQKRLGRKKFRLSRRLPTLISSTGNAPYPVALLLEFEELTRVACLNTRRRIASYSSLKKTKISKSKRFLVKRCRDGINWNQASTNRGKKRPSFR